MNRQDIIDKMTQQEREVFEKYKDTYPFPIRKFIKEIGIKIEYDDDPKNWAKVVEKEGVIYMIFSNHLGKQNKIIEDITLLMQLIHYLFIRSNPVYNAMNCTLNKLDEMSKISICVFLMPVDVFKRQVLKFNSNTKKIAKYFGVPASLIEFYAEYLKVKTIGLDPYGGSKDNINYH